MPTVEMLPPGHQKPTGQGATLVASATVHGGVVWSDSSVVPLLAKGANPAAMTAAQEHNRMTCAVVDSCECFHANHGAIVIARSGHTMLDKHQLHLSDVTETPQQLGDALAGACPALSDNGAITTKIKFC
jgi:hypothetical protein